MKHLKALAIVVIVLQSTQALSQGVVWSCFDAADLDTAIAEQRRNTKERVARRIKGDTIAKVHAVLSDGAAAAVDQKVRSQEFSRYLRNIVEPSTVTSMLTKTFNTTGYSKKPFVLDADVQIPITFGFKLNTFQVIPRFVIRIFNNDNNVPVYADRSLPVRTPSYIPSVSYYRTVKWAWMNPDRSVDGRREDFYFGATVFHHSNGQDGPEFYSQDPALVNLYNGNFSENVAFEGMIGGRLRRQAQWTDAQLKAYLSRRGDKSDGDVLTVRTGRSLQFSWRAGYEDHPRWGTNEQFLKYAMYGRHRLNLTIIESWLPTEWRVIRSGDQWCTLIPDSEYERWRLTIRATYILDGVYHRGNLNDLNDIGFFDVSKRLNIYAALYWVIPTTDFMALFARAGYSGSDPYNIYFNQSMWELKAGLAFGFFEQPDARLRN